MAEAPDHLSVLSDELLALSMPGPSYGPDRARWERDVGGVIARIFRLGSASGWDKAVAATSEPGPAREPSGPALVGEAELAPLQARLAEVELAITRVQRSMARGAGQPRRVVLAELAEAGGRLETAIGALREAT